MRAFADTSVEMAPLDGMALRGLQDSWEEWRNCTETIKVRTSQLQLSVSSGEVAIFRFQVREWRSHERELTCGKRMGDWRRNNPARLYSGHHAVETPSQRAVSESRKVPIAPSRKVRRRE